MNNLSIYGRITKELNLRTVTYKGVETKVLNFTVAADDGNRKDKDGNKVDTEFFRVTAWRGAAEAIAKYCTKGREICICGPVHLDKYTKDGKEVPYMGIPRPWYFEFGGKHVDNEVKPDDEELPWTDSEE